MQTCYRHPSRETGVSCSSCGRPICTDCMTATPVGMRCPECAKQRTQVRTAATMQRGGMQVTLAIVMANVLVFLGQALVAGGGLRARGGALYENGVLFGPLVSDGEWWRLLTSGFLHADPIHLLLNMVGVYFLGQILEPAFGSLRFAALYLGSLLAGSFGALLITPDAGTIGASGAVFGLLGAGFLYLRDRGFDPMRSFIGPILLINILFTFRPGISIGGHFGGLAGGLVCTLLLVEAARRRSAPLGLIGCLAVGLLASAGAIARVAALY